MKLPKAVRSSRLSKLLSRSCEEAASSCVSPIGVPPRRARRAAGALASASASSRVAAPVRRAPGRECGCRTSPDTASSTARRRTRCGWRRRSRAPPRRRAPGHELAEAMPRSSSRRRSWASGIGSVESRRDRRGSRRTQRASTRGRRRLAAQATARPRRSPIPVAAACRCWCSPAIGPQALTFALARSASRLVSQSGSICGTEDSSSSV